MSGLLRTYGPTQVDLGNNVITQPIGNLTPGSALIVVLDAFSSSTFAISSTTDSAGNTYTARPLTDTGYLARTRTAVFDCIARASDPTSIVGHYSTTAVQGNIVVFEVEGVTGYNTGIAANETSTTPHPGAITTTQTDTFLIVGGDHDDGTISLIPPSGFFAGPKIENNAISPISTGYRLVNSILTAFNPAWALGGSANFGSVLAAYTLAAPGSPAIAGDWSRRPPGLRVLSPGYSPLPK